MSGLLEFLLPYTAYLALLLRVVVGATYIGHGYPKLTKSRKQTVQMMKTMGVPAGATYLATILEVFGGLALVIGLLVPIVSLFFLLEMIGTTILKKTKMKGTYLPSMQNPVSYENDIEYILLAITLMVLGAGVLSLDGLLGL